jgi:acyl dehydratase
MPPQNIKRHLSHQNNMKWISKWFQVDQKLINSFAKVTLDNQFIHTDQNKAKETKFGSTIAHGFLTMSLLSAMYYDAVPENYALKMGINIGFDKLRFLAPVRCNDNIRGVFQLSKTAEKDSNIMTLTWDTRIEIDGSSKPALLASWIERQYF